MRLRDLFLIGPRRLARSDSGFLPASFGQASFAPATSLALASLALASFAPAIRG